MTSTITPPTDATRFWHDEQLGLDLGRACIASSRFKKHSHGTFIVIATEHGNLCATIHGCAHALRSGSVLILHPDEPHSGTPDSRSGWSFRAFYPEAAAVCSALQEVTGQRAEVPQFPTLIDSARVAQTLLNAHRMIESGEAIDRETGYLMALSALLLCAKGSRPQRAFEMPVNRVQLVKEAIHDRYAEPITVNKLAATVGCGPFQLMRAFERQVGVSVHTYLTQIRLRHACMLLARGEREADVAIAVGFSDQSHLIRRFKRAFGVTPGSYIQTSRCR